MTLPSLALALVSSLLLAAMFHLLVDGGPARLLLLSILSAMGFGAGQWVATSQGWSLMPVGPLQMGAAAAGSVAFQVVGHWLSKMGTPADDHTDTV